MYRRQSQAHGDARVPVLREPLAQGLANKLPVSLYVTALCLIFPVSTLDPISRLVFDPASEFLLSAGDKAIRVFHNVVGYRAAVRDLEAKR